MVTLDYSIGEKNHSLNTDLSFASVKESCKEVKIKS